MDTIIESAEGVQQGDPLGPLLLYLTLHCHYDQLISPLCVMYLDDVTVGGPMQDVLHDLEVIKSADVLGLSLNGYDHEA